MSSVRGRTFPFPTATQRTRAGAAASEAVVGSSQRLSGSSSHTPGLKGRLPLSDAAHRRQVQVVCKGRQRLVLQGQVAGAEAAGR